jgi:glycylpeptide N-tetradecanoyltransferase
VEKKTKTVKIDEEISESGPVEPDIPHDEIRKEPLPLPKDFEWCEINMEDENEVKYLVDYHWIIEVCFTL